MKQTNPGNTPRRGIFHEIGLEARLVVNLMADNRVSSFVKLIPVFGVLYIFNPVDFPGVLDDVLVLLISLVVFVVACPSAVVSEHRKRLRQISSGHEHDTYGQGDVIEGKFKDVEDKDQGDHRDS